MDNIIFEFAGFTLTPQRRALETNGIPIKLGSREFDILLALVEREGEVLTNSDILRIVWPNENVSEAIVRVRVALLRKALGDPSLARRLIATVVGGGYTFLGGAIRRSGAAQKPAISRIPAAVTKIFGRDLLVSQIEKALRRQRVISLVGPGGIGKTTVALEVCRRTAAAFEGVYIVDLGTLREGAAVSTELALVLGIGLHPVDPVLGIISYLRDRPAMVVFDTCEHVLPAVAALCTRLVEELRHVTMLCTSREPLEIRGETMFRLGSLDNPSEAAVLKSAEVDRYGAMQLFVDRAGANLNAFVLDDENVHDVAKLCRWLEGVPLAIEFAAARIHEFGLPGVLSRLEYRFVLLNKGKRNASSRHRSLKDTLQWSYSLLSDREAQAFRSLSCFAGNFPLGSAAAILSASAEESQDLLDGLVAKSLIIRGSLGVEVFYRMLDMTRDFAAEALAEEGTIFEIAGLHALDILRVLGEAETAWARGVAEDEAAFFAQRLGDIRNALHWCFSEHGDHALAVQLAANASIAFIPRGLMTEYRHWLELALQTNARASHRDRLLDSKLFASLGTALHHAGGPELKEDAERAFIRSAEASHEIGDAAGEMRAWSAVSAVRVVAGEYKAAIELAGKFVQIPGGKGSFVEHRTMAHSTLYNGDLKASGIHIDAVLGDRQQSGSRRTLGSVFDQRHVLLRSTQALRLFLLGKPDQALEVVQSCLEDATSAGHAISLCHTLATSAVPISVFVGDFDQARRHQASLEEVTTTQSILQWKGWANAFDVAFTFSRNDERKAPPGRADLLLSMPMGGMLTQYATLLAGGSVNDRLIAKAIASAPGWCLAELYRLRAELAASHGLRKQARSDFELALVTAQSIGTRAWELRAALSLAELRVAEGDSLGAQAILEPVLEAMTEGYRTIDYVRATEIVM